MFICQVRSRRMTRGKREEETSKDKYIPKGRRRQMKYGASGKQGEERAIFMESNGKGVCDKVDERDGQERKKYRLSL